MNIWRDSNQNDCNEWVSSACLFKEKQILITSHDGGDYYRIKFWIFTTGLLIKTINTNRKRLNRLIQINFEHFIAFYREDPLIEIYDVNKYVLLASIDRQKCDLLSMASCILSYNNNEFLIGSDSFRYSVEPLYQLRLCRWDINAKNVCIVKKFKQESYVWNLLLLPPCDANNRVQSFAHTSSGKIYVWDITNEDKCMFSFEAHKTFREKDIAGLSLITFENVENQLLSFAKSEMKLWSLNREFKYECIWSHDEQNIASYSSATCNNDILSIKLVPNCIFKKSSPPTILIGSNRGRFYLFDLNRKQLVAHEHVAEHTGAKEWEIGVYFMDFF